MTDEELFQKLGKIEIRQGKEREIKSYVLRNNVLSDKDREIVRENMPKFGFFYEDRFIDYKELFGSDKPVIIEIGFGMGKATAIIAENNPDINYLGVEVHRPGIGRLLGEIRRKNLQNLFIIEHDALEVLEQMIPDNSVAGYHIFFPDPWPKKKHHKRRLIQRPHTDLLVKKLAPGGYLYMVTDWEPYADFALEQLDKTPLLHNKYEGFAPRQTWRPETRFEEKGKNALRTIHELYFLKNIAGGDTHD